MILQYLDTKEKERADGEEEERADGEDEGRLRERNQQLQVGRVNPLPTNDAPIRHDLCELSISLWEFI